jgi:hypothetical protein
MDTTLFILVFLFIVFSYLAIDDVQKRIINKLKSKPESELDKNFEKIKALEEVLSETNQVIEDSKKISLVVKEIANSRNKNGIKEHLSFINKHKDDIAKIIKKIDDNISVVSVMNKPENKVVYISMQNRKELLNELLKNTNELMEIFEKQ